MFTKEQEAEALADAAERATAYRRECIIWPDAFMDAIVASACVENELTDEEETEMRAAILEGERAAEEN
jgi:hypothetical protein